MKQVSNLLGRIFMFVVIAVIILGSILEFYNISAGTGNWLGIFSIKWGVIILVLPVAFRHTIIWSGSDFVGCKTTSYFRVDKLPSSSDRRCPLAFCINGHVLYGLAAPVFGSGDYIERAGYSSSDMGNYSFGLWIYPDQKSRVPG